MSREEVKQAIATMYNCRHRSDDADEIFETVVEIFERNGYKIVPDPPKIKTDDPIHRGDGFSVHKGLGNDRWLVLVEGRGLNEEQEQKLHTWLCIRLELNDVVTIDLADEVKRGNGLSPHQISFRKKWDDPAGSPIGNAHTLSDIKERNLHWALGFLSEKYHLERYCEKAGRIVSTWPKWKREILGIDPGQRPPSLPECPHGRVSGTCRLCGRKAS